MIDRAYVEKQLDELAGDEDLSRYYSLINAQTRGRLIVPTEIKLHRKSATLELTYAERSLSFSVPNFYACIPLC